MENLSLLNEIFDNINEGIYILDCRGNYIYCNNAFLKMVGGSREEVLKLNAFQLIAQGQVTVSVAVKSFQKKKKLSIVNNVITPTGFHYRQMATATPIFDSEGEIEYMLVEMVRMDLLKKRYQKALLLEDEDCIEITKMNGVVEDKPSSFIAESPKMRQLVTTVEQVAQVDATILISGETGTGKEILARMIHQNSKRADKPMVEINCAALPENLLEAELFGYEKGAFTGALNTGKPGLVEIADGGTLFLDEINSLPLSLQGKFLRVLESRKSKRLGSVSEKNIDFRLLVATNEDLKECVENGTFRADMYYRLNVVPIDIPPLRERRQDIVPLVLFFQEYFSQKYGREKVFSKTVLDQMLSYDWPGNVRELKNVVERLIITSSVSSIEINSVPDNLLGIFEHKGEIKDNILDDWVNSFNSDACDMDNLSLKEYMERCEKQYISSAILKCGSSYKVAEFLKTNQSTIVRKRHKYNI